MSEESDEMGISEERRKILAMLSEGKISIEDAERLLDALQEAAPSAKAETAKGIPKYLRVVAVEGQGKDRNVVNIRVPLRLIRAGVKLEGLLPEGSREAVSRKLSQSGIDLGKLGSDDLDELVAALSDLKVSVVSGSEVVKIYCEG